MRKLVASGEQNLLESAKADILVGLRGREKWAVVAQQIWGILQNAIHPGSVKTGLSSSLDHAVFFIEGQTLADLPGLLKSLTNPSLELKGIRSVAPVIAYFLTRTNALSPAARGQLGELGKQVTTDRLAFLHLDSRQLTAVTNQPPFYRGRQCLILFLLEAFQKYDVDISHKDGADEKRDGKMKAAVLRAIDTLIVPTTPAADLALISKCVFDRIVYTASGDIDTEKTAQFMAINDTSGGSKSAKASLVASGQAGKKAFGKVEGQGTQRHEERIIARWFVDIVSSWKTRVADIIASDEDIPRRSAPLGITDAQRRSKGMAFIETQHATSSAYANLLGRHSGTGYWRLLLGASIAHTLDPEAEASFTDSAQYLLLLHILEVHPVSKSRAVGSADLSWQGSVTSLLAGVNATDALMPHRRGRADTMESGSGYGRLERGVRHDGRASERGSTGNLSGSGSLFEGQIRAGGLERSIRGDGQASERSSIASRQSGLSVAGPEDDGSGEVTPTFYRTARWVAESSESLVSVNDDESSVSAGGRGRGRRVKVVPIASAPRVSADADSSLHRRESFLEAPIMGSRRLPSAIEGHPGSDEGDDPLRVYGDPSQARRFSPAFSAEEHDRDQTPPGSPLVAPSGRFPLPVAARNRGATNASLRPPASLPVPLRLGDEPSSSSDSTPTPPNSRGHAADASRPLLAPRSDEGPAKGGRPQLRTPVSLESSQFWSMTSL